MSWPLADAASWAPLPGNRSRVLVTLCFIANGNANGRVWPGEEHLAARLRITTRRVRAHLRALERDGWLRTIAPHAPGRATTRELNCARILETARQERDRFEAHQRQHRTAASGVPEATPDSSVRCTPDISDANTGRQRPKNQVRTKSIKTTTQAASSAPPTPSAPDASRPPTVGELVDQYRALPGIERMDRDGGRIASLVHDFGADRVQVVLAKHGSTIANARKDPISLLAAILKNERSEQASVHVSIRSAAAVMESLDRVVVGRSAETTAVWDEVRSSLGIQNGNGAADTDTATISAAEAAKRAGVALVGDHLPPMPQRIPEEAAPA